MLFPDFFSPHACYAVFSLPALCQYVLSAVPEHSEPFPLCARYFRLHKCLLYKLSHNRSIRRLVFIFISPSFLSYFTVLCRSNTLSFALFARLFSSSSSSDGKIGFLVITLPFETFPHTHTGNSFGQVHGFSFFRKLVLIDSILQGMECDNAKSSVICQRSIDLIQVVL